MTTVADYLEGGAAFEDIEDHEFTDSLMRDFSFEDDSLVYNLKGRSLTIEMAEHALDFFETPEQAAEKVDDRLWNSVKAMEASLVDAGIQEFGLVVDTERGSEIYGDRNVYTNQNGYEETFTDKIIDAAIESISQEGYEELAEEMTHYR